MCKAIEDLKNEVYSKCKALGRTEGLLEGRINSILDALKDSPKELVRRVLHATVEEIAKAKALM